MIDERHEELAALHALDLLEGTDRDQFVAEMERSVELRRLVAALRQSATALAHLAPEAEPPVELRARVLASARGAAPFGSSAASSTAGRRVPFPTWIPWLAAACIAIGAIWSQRLYLSAEGDIAALREQQRLSQLALDKAHDEQLLAQAAAEKTREQLAESRQLFLQSSREVAALDAKLKAEGDLAHFKISMLASMLGNSPAALAVAVWDPAREQGVLSVSKLPALAAEKDYQLWVIDDAYPSPVSAGVFAVDPATGEARIIFKADKQVRSIAKFAVSLERKGGVPKPEGPIVLLSD